MAGTFNKTRQSSVDPGAVVYDAIQHLRFAGGANYVATSDGFTATGHNIANSVVQSRILLPFNCKIFGLWMNFASATLPAAQASVNVVLGTGAEAGTVPPNDNTDAGTTPPTVATAGQSIFASDFRIDNIAGLAQDVPVFQPSDNPDAIFPKGGLLTLRFVEDAGGTITAGQFTLVVKSYQTRPDLPNGSQFAPSNL